jgi:hypothetical protein
MNYSDSRKHPLWQIMSLLALLIMGNASITWAEATVPNVFTQGTTISSSQVNENFSALKSQMPAVKQVIPELLTSYEMTSTPAALMSISVTPPGNGYVLLTATGTVGVTHSVGELGHFLLQVSDVEGEATGYKGQAALESYIPTGFPSTVAPSGAANLDFGIPYSIVKVFPVNAGGSYTFYLNGYASGLNTAALRNPMMTAVFIPNALP